MSSEPLRKNCNSMRLIGPRSDVFVLAIGDVGSGADGLSISSKAV